jgi:hypothetical protein
MSNSQVSKDNREQADTWRDEHGQPDYEFLQSLMDDGSPRALEQMRNIADDLDAECGDDSSFEELLQSIRAAAERNDSGDSGIIS